MWILHTHKLWCPVPRLDLGQVSRSASARKALLKMNMPAAIRCSSKALLASAGTGAPAASCPGPMAPVISLKIAEVACCKAWIDLAWILATSWLLPWPLPCPNSPLAPRLPCWSQIYCHWSFNLFHSSLEKVWLGSVMLTPCNITSLLHGLCLGCLLLGCPFLGLSHLPLALFLLCHVLWHQ